MRKNDRTVHGLLSDKSAEIVRYDRSGKWYLEPLTPFTPRRHVSVATAAHAAHLGTHIANLPGGRQFDALVRREATSK